MDSAMDLAWSADQFSLFMSLAMKALISPPLCLSAWLEVVVSCPHFIVRNLPDLTGGYSNFNLVTNTLTTIVLLLLFSPPFTAPSQWTHCGSEIVKRSGLHDEQIGMNTLGMIDVTVSVSALQPLLFWKLPGKRQMRPPSNRGSFLNWTVEIRQHLNLSSIW
ncbi:uncharacterized protein [Physcomitrium patens]|uniref:uncharacterized protein n=1 Tax=Physcomitrium patens TaxID=3218 RepID=UPI003CCD5ACB